MSPNPARARPATLAESVRWLGRVDKSLPNEPKFAWSGTGFEALIKGEGLTAKLANDDGFLFVVRVDGERVRSFLAEPGVHVYALATGLRPGVHRVALLRQSEAQAGDTRLLGLQVERGVLFDPPAGSARLLEVVGDSISCGYGDLGEDASCPFSFATESHWHTYAAVAARALSAELSTIAVSGAGLWRNLDGTSKGTLPALYDRATYRSATPPWRPPRAPDAVIIHLGTNDFGRGDPGPSFEAAYLAFLERLRSDYPSALLVLAHGPMLYDNVETGELSLTHIRARLAAVVRERTRLGDARVQLVEFYASKEPELGCDSHPNAKKHAAMGAQLADVLRARLGW